MKDKLLTIVLGTLIAALLLPYAYARHLVARREWAGNMLDRYH